MESLLDKKAKINELVVKILNAKKAYYTGCSYLSDAAYDQLEEELAALYPYARVLGLVGHVDEDKYPEYFI